MPESSGSGSIRLCLRRAAGLVMLALMGAVLAHFSMAAHPRFLNLPSSVDSQMAILGRRNFVFEGIQVDFPSWRNRIVVPLMIRGVMEVSSASSSQAYILVRWVTACAALGSFAFLVRYLTSRGYWFCSFSAGILALSLFPTFFHIYEIPSDFLDAALFSLLLYSVLAHRRIAFSIILIISLLNREFALFAVVAWWAIHAWPFERSAFLRESTFCGVLGILGCALVGWLRIKNAVLPGHLGAALEPLDGLKTFRFHSGQVVDFFHHPIYGNPYFFLLGYMLFVAIVALAHWREMPSRLRRLGGVAAFMYLTSVICGDLDELRIDIPELVICTLLLAWIASKEEFRADYPLVLGQQ